MSKKYETKCICVYDHKIFLPMAERLAKDFGRVLYYSPWKDSSPQKKNTLVGYGLEGVERINNFWDYLPEMDCIAFPDILEGDLQLHLRDIGKQVWGSFKGEELEMDRIGAKELMKQLNLPVGEYEVVKGIDNLRKYLKSNKDTHVKIDIYRGDFESFFSPNYEYTELKLNDIEQSLGAIKNEVEFICEKDLPDRTELGYDGYCVDGQFPSKTMIGIEIKDCGYTASFKDYNKFPSQITDVNTALSDILKVYGYRNFFSTEVRIGKDKVGYPIDFTCRNGAPPSELMYMMYTNFSDIVWEGSQGNLIDPIPENKFGVELIMTSTWAETKWLPVQFPEKYKDNLKFKSSCIIDGQRYIIPQTVGLPEIGSIVTTGKTMEYAIGKAEEIADEVRAYYIEVPKQSLDKAKDEIEKLKSFGIDLFK